MDLKDNIKTMKGVGDKTAALLQKLGINTVEDLLLHIPVRYEKLEEPVSIDGICPGEINAIKGVVLKRPQFLGQGRKKYTVAYIKSGERSIRAIWFNAPYLVNAVSINKEMIYRGRVTDTGKGLILDHPRIIDISDYREKMSSLQPVYRLTEGVSLNMISGLVKKAVSQVEDIEDFYPPEIKEEFDIIDYKTALRTVHFPANEEELLLARKRLIFDEFLVFILKIRSLKKDDRDVFNHYRIPFSNDAERLIQSLPYKLTKDQQTVLSDITKDMMSKRTMNRLLQGDVGSGKTIIALISLLNAVKAGHQGCLMAPTEILAKQHYETFKEMLGEYDVNVAFLSGSMTKKQKDIVYKEISEGDADIVIGTHAVIQDKVIFRDLALIVTDEQHRFGVAQRNFLSEKGMDPHILVMSATPIPRTLAIIIYGDLDISVIKQLPENRLPIKNVVIEKSDRKKAYAFIKKEIDRGKQAYIICPMVEESEVLDIENVTDYTEDLKKELGSGYSISCLHGRMKASEKESVMKAFQENRIQIIVSTTVVEVGINVPNATVMMVENAERFGLAQLHQLRGRVGRGDAQSYCIFIDGSGSDSENERLKVLENSNDGFEIASEDLKLRGPGDLFGIRQSGIMEFRVADMVSDMDILKAASKACDIINKEISCGNEDSYKSLLKKVSDAGYFRDGDIVL